MLKAELISEVQKDEYKTICKKLLPHLWKDLYQELCMAVLESPEERIERIKNENGARFYLVGIICNMAQSSTSQFYFKYRNTYLIDEQTQEDNDNELEQKIDKITCIYEGIKKNKREDRFKEPNYFDAGILERYMENGSIRKTVEDTKISFKVVYNSLNNIKKKIRLVMNPIKVLLVTTKEDTGLKYHRQIVPNQRLSVTNPEFKFTNLTGQIIEGKRYEATIDGLDDETLKKFDIIYFLRQISFNRGNVERTIDRCHSLGVKVILDIDDYWVLNKDHFMYDTYRSLGVADETQKAIRLVDHVITTTEYFANKIRPLNPNVTILPNCISPDDQQFKPSPVESKLVRIGWIGGVYHKSDIAAISDAFCRLARDKDVSGKYQICLGGYNVINTGKNIIANAEYSSIERSMTCNYEFRNYDKPYFEYLQKNTQLMEHYGFFKHYRRLWGRDVFNYGQLYNEIDVALAPLIPNEFNKCKSELKVIEAGWMGKAVICTDTEPYNKVIEHEDNGLLINPDRPIDWYLSMKRLILDREYRNELAQNLNDDIHTYYNIDRHNQKRTELYKSLCSVSV